MDPNAATPQATSLWKALPVEEVLRITKSQATGLTTSDATARLDEYGRNQLPPARQATIFERIWGQLSNVLMAIMIAAAIIKLVFESYVDSGFVWLVIVLNVIIGIVQEGKAESAAKAIGDMLAPSAIVLRDGSQTKLDAALLVPGDVVLLKAGDRVPADLRVIESSELQTLEAMLTGEAEPVSKRPAPVDGDAPLAETKSMVFSGTMVVFGQGRGIVVATGIKAEIGKISESMSAVERPRTPLMVQLDQFGWWLSIATMIIALVTFLVEFFVRDGDLPAAFGLAVSVAVAIIPEGLPAVVTVTLALAVNTMARHNAIVRNLPAVETLGCVSVICSDKTGTLTKNQMTVTSFVTSMGQYMVSGIGYEPKGRVTQAGGGEISTATAKELSDLLIASALCTTTSLQEKIPGRWSIVGTPTEGALRSLHCKLNGESMNPDFQQVYPTIFSIPFQSEYKFMATVHDLPGPNNTTVRVALIKGAAERLLPLCNAQAAGNSSWAAEPIDQAAWEHRISSLAKEGLRVLSLCRMILAPNQSTITPADVTEGDAKLQLDGIVAIIDPPREEAIAAVATCQKAGVCVKMITGDSPITAGAIGKKLGIGSELVLTGQELDRMTTEDLRDKVIKCNVYARMSPENKLQIIQALLYHKQVTAMTGDGVNDAIALRQASVGVAMGITGTEVAKDAATMILADDNFATLETAVCQGRCVFDNLLKILAFALPTNLAQGMGISIAVFSGLRTPLDTVQVLYINMITSVTMGVVLAVEEPEPDIMDRPPRRHGKPILGQWVMWRTFIAATIMVTFMLGNAEWESNYEGRNKDDIQTVAMTTLVLCQCAYVYSCRFLRLSSLRLETLLTNRLINYAVVLNIALLCFLIYVPLVNDVFKLTSIDGDQWGRCAMFAIAMFILVEIDKHFAPKIMTFLRPILAPYFNPILDCTRGVCSSIFGVCFKSCRTAGPTVGDDAGNDSKGAGSHVALTIVPPSDPVVKPSTPRQPASAVAEV